MADEENQNGQGDEVEAPSDGESQEEAKPEIKLEDIIPEEYRQEKMFTAVKDVPSLVKNYVEAQKYIGGAVKMPTEESTQDDWDKFYGKLGRPESSEGYHVQSPETLQEIGFDDGARQQFLRGFHSAGLNNSQVQNVLNVIGQYVTDSYNSASEGNAEGMNKLMEDWGENSELNTALAQRAVSHLGGDDLKDRMDKSGLGNDPLMVGVFAKVGAMLAEDGVIVGSVEGVKTTDSAKEEITRILNDATDAYHKSDKPGHEDRVKYMSKLYQLAYN